MERESFEDAATARVMNEHFVCVKVDREERPDLDSIYMDAVVALTGSGGWPMTVFLTPDGRAVLRRHVLPAGAAARAARRSSRCCSAVAEAWREQRDEVERSARNLAEHIRSRRAARSRRADPLTTSCSTRRSANLRAGLRPAVGRLRAARRSSRPRPCSSSCCAAARRR